MEMYKILMELNRKVVFAEKIVDTEKEAAVTILLNGVCSKEDILKYKKRMRVNTKTDQIYPDYYIPPYNENKKLAYTDINNEKTKDFIAQKKECLLDLLRRGWVTGKLSNGKISEGDCYNLMGKYIIRNAIGTLPGYEDISKYPIYINDRDERCYCDI